MKNFPWRKIGFFGFGLIAVVIAVFYFIPGKGAKTFNSAINPAFGEYISSYTAGVVSSGSPIRVIFSKDAVDSSAIGTETTTKLFEFSRQTSHQFHLLVEYIELAHLLYILRLDPIDRSPAAKI